MVREIQIKITLRHKFSVILAKPQKFHAIEYCLGCREMGTLIIACENAKWNNLHGEDLTISGTITHGFTFSPSIPTSRKLSQGYIGKIWKDSTPVCNNIKNWIQPLCLLVVGWVNKLEYITCWMSRFTR